MLTERPLAKPLSHGEFAAALTGLARFETLPFVAVAVSGGADSLALAILADRWARERGGAICALSVDHRLRRESGDEVRQVGAWLSARAIRHEVLVWSGEKPRTGIEEAARIARYRLLDEWCRDQGCLHLLTAHHQDDQIETHLIRQRAQSGADGLAGMSVVRELSGCRVLRPLLGFAKARLVALLAAENQPFIADPSNFDPAFERSRLRRDADAMPQEANRADLLAQIAEFGYARAARERDSNSLLARSVSLHPAGFALLDPDMLGAASDAIANRLLTAVVATIGGRVYPPRRERLDRLRIALGSPATRGHTLGGCHFRRWRRRVLVLRELAAAEPPAPLAPGQKTAWDRRFEIVAPAAANDRLRIGYLGRSGVEQLNRVARQSRRLPLPRLLLSILPGLWDEHGLAAVPHLGYQREGVGTMPQVVFRPPNPLTQAGFAVV